MVIKVDKKTLTKRAQSKVGSVTYKPTAKNLAKAVRNTPGVRQNATPRTILNLPRDVMVMVDPTGQVYRSIASVPNLRHVPKRFPSKRGSVRMTRNQAARRIQSGARNTINKGLAKRVDRFVLKGSVSAGTASPVHRNTSRIEYAILDYLRKNPAPTNRNIGAAVNIAAIDDPPLGWFTPAERLKLKKQLDEHRLQKENYIAKKIESYRPFLAARSPQRSSRSTRPSRNRSYEFNGGGYQNSSNNGSL